MFKHGSLTLNKKDAGDGHEEKEGEWSGLTNAPSSLISERIHAGWTDKKFQNVATY